MTFEEFRNLTQGIQAIFVAFGAIIASGWAIYTFKSLLSVQKAKAELAKIDIELDKSRVELVKIQNELHEKPMVSVELDPQMLGSHNPDDLFIRVKLRLQNTGNTAEYIDWGSSSIKAAKVLGVEGEKLIHSNIIQGALGRIGLDPAGEALWPGEVALDEAIVPIIEQGIYVVYAEICVSNKSTEIIASIAPEPVDQISFGCPVYFDTRCGTQLSSVA
ncbi:TPA: hypothetical protein NG675_002517 [Vibrio parahaemolyticus]|uniref:hypothetical protein n=1 Tax=Vibrio harveyi group TaxID=717610 RepID=UPI001121D66F|nr:hypothetical protein [Vibrio parahaemolyticus]EIZ1047432.1 hypothetical protein [Vibrio parahaemolyticus]MDF4375069.1 hypothetical protein [Vibrio parahaemolyticus]TOP05972.1 hypothetical protein CGH23_22210 [Vibrio parahaemolyticus]HCE2816202.1 hypothetical protein [Vibrio parahaemolyticus]HCG5304800.1 hypothetical protein [Vibrio parahaemolyticus]